jgi:cell division protein FtsL
VVVAVAIFVVTYYPVARVQYRETRRLAQYQNELKALQTRNQKLSVQVARLKTNEGVEDYARSQLGMVKKGENVVVVTDGTRPAKLTTAPVGAAPVIETSGIPSAAPTGAWTEFLDAVFSVQ